MAEERRVVTILFADVAGSTALGESLDPEDARILLRRYYDIARETVAEHGGILEKFIGDAVVAVFGFPKPMTTIHSGRCRQRSRCAIGFAASPHWGSGCRSALGSIRARWWRRRKARPATSH